MEDIRDILSMQCSLEYLRIAFSLDCLIYSLFMDAGIICCPCHTSLSLVLIHITSTTFRMWDKSLFLLIVFQNYSTSRLPSLSSPGSNSINHKSVFRCRLLRNTTVLDPVLPIIGSKHQQHTRKLSDYLCANTLKTRSRSLFITDITSYIHFFFTSVNSTDINGMKNAKVRVTFKTGK